MSFGDGNRTEIFTGTHLTGFFTNYTIMVGRGKFYAYAPGKCIYQYASDQYERVTCIDFQFHKSRVTIISVQTEGFNEDIVRADRICQSDILPSK